MRTSASCLVANETDDNPKTRHYHAAVMVRFEETLRKRIDQKLSMSVPCAELGVRPERCGCAARNSSA
jgi:hypothetical protein